MMSVLSARRGPTVSTAASIFSRYSSTRVQPAHPPEQVVVARLHRKVELLADRGKVAHRREQLAGRRCADAR